jgi:Tellurite resistance protein TerB
LPAYAGSVMSDIAAAGATIVIDRPVDVVRAQLFDVDHAIRARIHHGVSLRWLPPQVPGERRVEQAVKVLTRTHVDVFVVEQGEGGVWVKRFVAGPNQGVRLVAELTPEEGRTRVRIVAFVGPGGYHTGVGKLSQLGLDRMLHKLLEEHRRALEGYEPGRARGAVQAALGPMREAVVAARIREGARADPVKARAMMSNLLEAACVVAVADGQVDGPERDVIQEVARSLCFLELDAAAVDRMAQNVAAAVAAEGIGPRCEKIATRLTALGLGDVGLGVAALVAEISHGIDAPELAALSLLAAALGVGDAALTDRIHDIDRALSGGA